MKIWHPFTQHALFPELLNITAADGAYLYNDNGDRIVDAISSWWVITHQHCHPKIIAAVKKQAEILDQVIFAGVSHEPALKVAKGLSELLPDELKYVFFSDSGSTSVEVAIKMALGYWGNEGQSRDKIVVMEHSYHGDTIGAMSVGERGVFNQQYQRLLFEVGTIPFPKYGSEQDCLDKLEKYCQTYNIAALLIEPLISGAGGMLIYPAWVLKEMRNICSKYDVLFIADEVMTGWGRTGSIFACEKAGVIPDIACYSKGLTGGFLPLAVTVCQERIYKAHYSKDRRKTFFHSSSYTANPIACSAAVANIDLWRTNSPLQEITNLTNLQTDNLKKLYNNKKINNIRQIGTIAAFDICVNEAGYLADIGLDLYRYFISNNVLLRPLGNTIYIMPPYCISKTDLGNVYDIISDSLMLCNV